MGKKEPTRLQFSSVLENFQTRLWTYHIKVPMAVANVFLSMGDKRVICTINAIESFQCAIMPAGNEVYFININKKIRDKLNIREGDRLQITLEKDESEFGLPFPEEFKEVLIQTPEAKQLFDRLTPGKQRNLIYIVNQVKRNDLKIQRSLAIAAHLIQQKGKINFKQLAIDLKESRD